MGIGDKEEDVKVMVQDEKLKAVAPLHRSTFKSICLVVTCTAAMILNTANSTSISIALPTIGRDLRIEEYKLQWLVSAYSLSSGCLLMFLGRVADLYGRKRTFLLGIVVLGSFGLGCGFAQDEITLDILRGFQGVGGAAIIPASLGILAHAFPPSKARAIAFATFAAGAPIGAALGSLIGGVLTQLTSESWRSTFYLLTGLSVLAFIGGMVSIDADVLDPEQDRRIDWLGGFLVTTGLVLIVFVLGEGSIAPQGWKTPYIIVLLVLGVILVTLFLFWQHHLEKVQAQSKADSPKTWLTPPPLMKLSVWSRAKGRLAVMLFIGFLEWCSFLSWTFWVQLFYQNFLRLTPVLTMIRLLPMFVTGVICNAIVAVFVGRIDFVYLILIGTTFTAVANLLFALIEVKAVYWAFGFPAAIASVFGADFVFAAGSLFVAKVSLPHEQSVSGALLQTMMQLGASFGLTITTIIFNSVVTRESEKLHVPVDKSGLHAPPSVEEKGYKAAFWGGFAFGILGAVLAAVFLRGVGIVGHRPEKQKVDIEGKGIEEDAEEDGVAVDDAESQVTATGVRENEGKSD